MLSLEQNVGQMMMVGFDGKSPPRHILRWLSEGRIGGVYLFARNIESPAQVKQLIDDCRGAANQPILVGIDQEGGIVARLRDGFTESPGAMALGAAGDSRLAENVALMMGRELAALGINWNFAPVADIAHKADNPSVSTRSIGRDKALVSEIVAAQIRGFQRAGVAATVKHFPGLGNSVIDTHEALARVTGSLDYLYDEDLLPFRAAIDADVACVMLTHVMFEALDSQYPATMSPSIVNDLLREELGYDGAVCTDCMEMKAITDGFGAGESAVLAILAGIDMPLFSHTRERQKKAYESVLAAVKSGRIPNRRIDESVKRITDLKRRFELTNRPPIEVVGCEAHAKIATNAARAGTVLVKRGATIPLDTDAVKVAVVEMRAQRISDAVDARSRSTFSRYLTLRLPHASCHAVNPRLPETVANMQIKAIVRSADVVILLTRNAHMQPRHQRLAQSIIDQSKQVILVCARNPYDAGLLVGADTVICTNGDSKPSLKATVDAICGDFVPSGKLTVTLP